VWVPPERLSRVADSKWRQRHVHPQRAVLLKDRI
jgi:hypothetical protein